ncbi:hypothetical protein DFH06DRAFT_1334184 [Mycena polygramma]|nr:hypothetical protein DFH06DRAFT_1334184 [Mycena polygramma]
MSHLDWDWDDRGFTDGFNLVHPGLKRRGYRQSASSTTMRDVESRRIWTGIEMARVSQFNLTRPDLDWRGYLSIVRTILLFNAFGLDQRRTEDWFHTEDVPLVVVIVQFRDQCLCRGIWRVGIT